MEIKTKINQWDLIKSFFTTKKTISKVKRQHSELEKRNETDKESSKYVSSPGSSIPEKQTTQSKNGQKT